MYCGAQKCQCGDYHPGIETTKSLLVGGGSSPLLYAKKRKLNARRRGAKGASSVNQAVLNLNLLYIHVHTTYMYIHIHRPRPRDHLLTQHLRPRSRRHQFITNPTSLRVFRKRCRRYSHSNPAPPPYFLLPWYSTYTVQQQLQNPNQKTVQLSTRLHTCTCSPKPNSK